MKSEIIIIENDENSPGILRIFQSGLLTVKTRSTRALTTQREVKTNEKEFGRACKLQPPFKTMDMRVH